MNLVLRPQASEFIPEWDWHKFWSVYCDEVSVGVIVLQKGRSDEPAEWRWVIHLHAGRFDNGGPAKNGSAPTREAAMVVFRQAFERCREHIGDDGWALHVEHMALVGSADRSLAPAARRNRARRLWLTTG